MKFSFYTLGCKVNQYETQAMQQMLLSHGHTLGEFDEPCDGYIVNSCTVTAVSDKKTRNAIRRAQKLNPNAAVGVCGCYAQSAPDEVRALGVDVMVGTADREAFVLQMEQAAQDKASHAHWEKVEPSGLPRAFEQLPAGGLAARTRALLKIEDGCNSFCTYCIIPYARGRVRSMPLEAAVSETKKARAGRLSRDRHQRHRSFLLGLGMERRQPSSPASSLRLRGRTGRPHPPWLFGAAHHRRGILHHALRLQKPLPAVPPQPPERQRHRTQAHEPQIRYPPVFRKRPPAPRTFPQLRRHYRPHRRLSRRN